MAVHVDPRLSSAALAHGLENAAQYSAAETTIEIDCRVDRGELQIDVRDHGTGLRATDLNRVFDRFYRGAAGQQRFGTGMGLAITRGLLAAQGGRVSAANEATGGARFTLAVPVTVRPAAELREEPE